MHDPQYARAEGNHIFLNFGVWMRCDGMGWSIGALAEMARNRWLDMSMSFCLHVIVTDINSAGTLLSVYSSFPFAIAAGCPG
jgi:hypothetical protein